MTHLAANNAAVELLGMAKNRMNKFYNSKMYKAKRELSEEERIAGTGVEALQMQGAPPPPPPETWGAYSKKSEESNGVLAMIDMLVADLETEIQEMEFNEKDDQAEYEEMIKDSAAKRASDS